MQNDKEKNLLQIQILFLVIITLFFIFLLRVFFIALNKPSFFISTKITHKDLAIRGRIVSKDNFILAENKKNYSVAIIPKYIASNKRELFINLLSIYTNTPIQVLKQKINFHKPNTRQIIFKHIPYEIEKNLPYLSSVFSIYKVFLPNKKNITYGLDIVEQASKRVYPFKNRLQPILGYIRENKQRDGMGLEKFYDDALIPKQNGIIYGVRDVKDRIILDKTSSIIPRKDGDLLTLNINFILQGKIENILDKMKQELNAKEVLAVVMESKSGKVISIASSNRYNPMHIKQNEIPYLKISHIQYTYEPGSVMKPITLALLLKHHKVNIYKALNAHNGVFHFKRNFTIYDDDKFRWLNTIQAVIHSSNIVFAQLGLRLTPKEFRDGLLEFGFNQKSGIDLPYEYRGILFNLKDLTSEIHRASNSFGYGLRVNLIQLLKAYNVFNNQGIMVTPKIAYSYGSNLIQTNSKQILNPAYAQTILNILRKVVLQGTAKAANIKGLFIAGKTGTAKINKNGKYIKGLYNSSFIGFVNDKKHKYTIATLVIKPDKKRYFASQTAVVIFKKIVKTMIDMNLLTPKKTE